MISLCSWMGLEPTKKVRRRRLKLIDKQIFSCFLHIIIMSAFPLVLLEAMQHSLPCISTNEGAISDIVDDGVTGYVVGARNADHLAAKTEVLLNDNQQRMDMGENGYRKYQEQFTLDVFEKRMSEVLEQLM